MTDTMQQPTRKKLFGVSHPIGKAIISIAFVVLTGGLGLVFILLGMIGDKMRTKSKA